uniref:Secreted protein n=1 Tax=Steinernema glaseri TaxID=37863 RepID=A0A1I7YE13_9BILA
MLLSTLIVYCLLLGVHAQTDEVTSDAKQVAGAENPQPTTAAPPLDTTTPASTVDKVQHFIVSFIKDSVSTIKNTAINVYRGIEQIVDRLGSGSSENVAKSNGTRSDNVTAAANRTVQ